MFFTPQKSNEMIDFVVWFSIDFYATHQKKTINSNS